MENNEYRFYRQDENGYPNGYGSYSDPEHHNPLEDTPRKHKKGSGGKAIALVLACAIAGGGAGIGGAAFYNEYLSKKAQHTTVVQEIERPQVETVVNVNKNQPMTPQQLYAANLPSCVGITVSTTTINLFGQTSTSAASGSGFVLTADGYVVTNYHVIEDAVKDSSVTVEVSFANGEKYSAIVVGGEQDNDVAVLKIEAAGLTPVTMGDSSKLVVGESVYAIGNPLGELTYSLSDGLVSALDRLITTSSTNPSTGTVETTTLNVLQTNCAINPGNSGGPLFDSYGSVVGIVSAKYTRSQSGVSAEGLGFALPINDVKAILTDLIEHGYVTGKPYMGVQVTPVSGDAQRYGIPAGAAVDYVAAGSCAEKAGLKAGDIITAIDGTAIDSPSALTAALSSNYKAGESATLTVMRDQQELKLSITFDEKNSQTEANNQIQQDSQQQQQQTPNGSSGGFGNYGGGNYYYQWPFDNFFNW